MMDRASRLLQSTNSNSLCFEQGFAEIDLSALMHNLLRVKQCISPSCSILGIVKADAYGHGAIDVSKTLLQGGVKQLGVASLAEGIQLREAGINVPILVMGGLWDEYPREIRAYSLTPVIYDFEVFKKIALTWKATNSRLSVHIKVDTGMRRLGLSLKEARTIVCDTDHNLSIEGLMTHLSQSEIEDGMETKQQLNRFKLLMRDIKQSNIHIPFLHMANSAAIISAPDTHINMVRPGLMLYGYSLAEMPRGMKLRPVLSLKTRIVQIKTVNAGERVGYGGMFRARRNSRIAILPVGYSDGYNRGLSACGKVLIGGRAFPIAGRISMNMTAVDITEHKAVMRGEEVVLLGVQGKEAITAADLAAQIHTIPYEVLCWAGAQFPRRYLSRATDRDLRKKPGDGTIRRLNAHLKRSPP